MAARLVLDASVLRGRRGGPRDATLLSVGVRIGGSLGGGLAYRAGTGVERSGARLT